MAGPVIAAGRMSKRFRLYRRRHQSIKEILVRRSLGDWEDLWAVKDLTFEVPRGQFLGVIGHNGSGKSTLLKLLSQILTPDAGSLEIVGRVSSLLELGAGFQPEYTGRENVYLYGSLLGLRKRDIVRAYESIPVDRRGPGGRGRQLPGEVLRAPGASARERLHHNPGDPRHAVRQQVL